ncbi:WD40 repeat domain-containing serine/threonine protein kinase [Paraliomyxa miuraensis]|uniref:WD40 repeat domain-containing serine/threonine protein kinase n=1 Tax=Paraliomyxa miuraensis TaxID=376150 RepID=UPI00224D16CF|nr:serine/threonine-protein kinase [Paraliomyxa miuraensis]MCX4246674.1 serine/threonine-protein kinase [Paraliomyxa miuraensis]
MSGARPGDPDSPESRAWLQRVRANVKAQLFGGAVTAPTDDGTLPGEQQREPPKEPVRIGRYVVIKRIGEGGMGMVYAAYDDALDRKVAVKLLHPRGTGAGGDAKARLIREAQALARLSHPSVIHVYEVDAWEDQVFVAMEFVDGSTLAQWQRQEGRTWKEVLEAYVAAGRGLAAAHASGIIHRDFKAANVLVRRDGAVRVVDFGLARQELEAGALMSSSRPVDLEGTGPGSSLVTADGSADGALTRTGVIMGTPAYMAPEQHLGQRADARCDQFAYCVSLYEALYGFRPFGGETLPALRRNVLAGRIEQPPRYTDIPPRIFRVLERGLQVHPDERYPAMEPLLDELARDPRAALQRLAYLLLAVLAVGLVAGLWWSEREEREARTEGERLRVQLDRARVLNAEEELRRMQSRSVSEKRDDLVLAYAREVIDDDPTMALAALKQLTPDDARWLPAARTIAADAVQRGVIRRRLDPGLGRVERMVFAEQGHSLFIAGRGVGRWDLLRQELLRPSDPGVPLRDLAVTPDGRRLVAVGTDDALYHWEFDEQGRESTPMRRLPSDDGSPLSVAVSSDGERVALGTNTGLLRIQTWDGSGLRAYRNHKGPISSLDFSPDGAELASVSRDGTLRQWDLEGDTHVVLEVGTGIRRIRFDGKGEYLWSTSEDGMVRRWSAEKRQPLAVRNLHGVSLLDRTPSGHRTLVCNGERELMLHGDGDPQPLRGHAALVTAIALSANGAWAAAATGDEGVLLWHLRGSADEIEPDGSRVTTTNGPITALAFSSNGSLLASATRQGLVQLWSERGEPRGTLGQHTRTILDLGFSPRGHELVALDEDGALLVWSVADRDQPVVRLRSFGMTGVTAWSPDGDRIAAPECENGYRCELVLYPLSRAEPRRLSVTDSPPSALRFSPSGRHLLSDHPTGSWLWDLDEGRGRALEWPDGQQPDRRLAFAYVRGGVRMATSDNLRDESGSVVSTTLRVWHIGQDSGNVHLLFEEPELRELLVDAEGRTLLLHTHDDNTILWRLAGDHFRLLPAIGMGYDRLRVSPDARALLLRPRLEKSRDIDALWVDVESGQMRRFSRRNDPLVWSSRGVLADAFGRRGVRIWSDPTPADPARFLSWLHESTDAELDPSMLR